MYMEIFREKILPSLSHAGHKGSAGRVAIVGGSLEYSGAPFFAGMSALRSGSDLATIFTVPSAATPIKSYSPDLITLPILPEREEMISTSMEKIISMLPRYHAIGVGPGLSKSPIALKSAEIIIQSAMGQGIPLVIDADAISIVSKDILKSCRNGRVVITPNINELRTLYKSNDLEKDQDIEKLCHLLKESAILVKGPKDVIYWNGCRLESTETGSPRRCGGQGDILVGVLCSFLASLQISGKYDEYLGITCVAACDFVRESNRFVYEKFGRSMVTSDIIDFMRIDRK